MNLNDYLIPDFDLTGNLITEDTLYGLLSDDEEITGKEEQVATTLKDLERRETIVGIGEHHGADDECHHHQHQLP